MATLQEQADEFFNMDEFQNAFPLYLQIWEREKNEYNGKQLLKCYRKAGKFTEAYNFYDTLFTLYPNSGGVKLGKLWLDYSCKIKDFKNDNLIADAEELLTKTDKYNDFTGDIYNKTVLSVVKRLIYNEENNSAQTWLEKLDFSVLKTSPFSIHGQKYPSDQKEFFIRYADVLIKLDRHIDYIESC